MGAAIGALLLGGLPAMASQRGDSSAKPSAHRTPGYLGVYLRAVNPQSGAKQNGKSVKGAEIVGVDRDAPAGKVGLEPHDLIVAVNGHSVTNAMQVQQMLHSLSAGRTIHLRIVRDGKPRTVTVTLASRAKVEAEAWPNGVILADGLPDIRMASNFGGVPFAKNLGPNVSFREFVMVACDGLDVEPIGKQLANFFGVSQGMGLLVRHVDPHSSAAAAGLEAGDVITAANGMPSGTLRGWLMVVSQNQGKTVKLKIIRNHKTKLIHYTPAGHTQQSRMTPFQPFAKSQVPGGWTGDRNGGISGAQLSWFWASSTVRRP